MPEGSYTFHVGSIGCSVLSDGYVAYPTNWFFPNADPDRLRQALEARHMPTHTVISPYTCLLIETGRNVILVDTGAGAASPTTGAIRARLEMLGVRPRDVDTVVLTHAHPDHIGGLATAYGQPIFRNARHILAEREFEFWTGRADLKAMRVPDEMKASMTRTARQALAAVRFQIETVDREREIVAGVRVLPAAGHTPGHLAVLVSDGGEHLLNVGDAAVHPLHLEDPTLENGFDLAPGEACATRQELLDRAVAERAHLLAFHFPFPSVGRVAARRGGGWDWTPGW